MAESAAQRAALTHVPATVAFPESALVDALQSLAGAASGPDVADAVCGVLVELPGVRAVAVLEKDEHDAVVVGSSGYGCGTMAYGARLPLDSGLPATEAVRTGRVVRQGEGPGWCAVPFGRRTTAPGAVLLSVDAAPPAAEADVARLQRLATAVGDALARTTRTEQVAGELTCLLTGLAPVVPSGPDVAVCQVPRGGQLGGDAAVSSTVGDTTWLVVADVCGSGIAAATGAAAVRTAVHALLPYADGPAALLAMLDRALRPEAPAGGFVTAVVATVRDGVLTAASAGHPAPVVLCGADARELPLEPGPPLALEMTDTLPRLSEHRTDIAAGSLLALYTDGLTDHRGSGGTDLDVMALVRPVAATGEPQEVARLLLAAADAAGAAVDDTTVLVARI